MDTAMINTIIKAIGETVIMVLSSSLLAYLIGVPLGIFLVVTDKNGIRPLPAVNVVVGVVINLLRAVPFIILLIMLIPFTRAIVGTTLGVKAIIPPLVIAAFPYLARMVESSLKEVDSGVIEAAKSMGASDMQIILKVMLPESLPSLMVGTAISMTTILGYTAMGGFTGAGGLGTVAINYGYYRYETTVMLITVAIMVVMVQIIQEFWMRLSKKKDKRIK